MIDLYTWATPNGRKVSMMLEECELEYKAHPINISKDQQFAPEFLKVSPNNKIPAIVDNDTRKSLMESGAIMMYLSEKTGKFLPQDPERKWSSIQWLMFQMGGVGPIFGQCHHFTKHNSGKVPYAEDRYHKETKRLYGVMNDRLAKSGFLGCEDFTIADMAVWPWVARFDWQSINLNEFPNVKRWYLEILERPATRRGWNVPENQQEIPMP
ncbi:MAG: Disulfide-bond oxidoreductase YfcG [Alphaproteobacteria bacterium MarineAlpha11_Bin1]|nr:MAG: Disulfide-bond oxidoreductase YfcG [Alphaproteobacteria bacterium MarineAlpha11_Bin1]